MAKISANAETIREMKGQLNKTVNDLKNIGQRVLNARSLSDEWNDAKGEQFRALMQRIGRLIEQPIGPLQAAQPKLEKLAQLLDEYNRVKF